MKKFVLMYWGKPPEKPPEDPKAEMKMWIDWMQNLVQQGKLSKEEQGHPFSKSKVLSQGQVRDSGMRADDGLALMGYTPVLAADFEQALEIAKTCPAVKFCSIEIHEAMDLPS